jgi:hypothetical protein
MTTGVIFMFAIVPQRVKIVSTQQWHESTR